VFEDKNEKEKKRKKRLADFLFFLHSGRMNEGVDVSTPALSKKKEKPQHEEPKKKDEEVKTPHSPRLAMVRNRLTNKRERAEERWNRFAGTSDGGGRGR